MLTQICARRLQQIRVRLTNGRSENTGSSALSTQSSCAFSIAKTPSSCLLVVVIAALLVQFGSCSALDQSEIASSGRNDIHLTWNPQLIRNVQLRYGMLIDKLTTTANSKSMGGGGGYPASFELDQSDFVFQIVAYQGEALDSLTFSTNKNKTFRYGGDGGNRQVYTAPQGQGWIGWDARAFTYPPVRGVVLTDPTMGPHLCPSQGPTIKQHGLLLSLKRSTPV
jgi:hypothetical protein